LSSAHQRTAILNSQESIIHDILSLPNGRLVIPIWRFRLTIPLSLFRNCPSGWQKAMEKVHAAILLFVKLLALWCSASIGAACPASSDSHTALSQARPPEFPLIDASPCSNHAIAPFVGTMIRFRRAIYDGVWSFLRILSSTSSYSAKVINELEIFNITDENSHNDHATNCPSMQWHVTYCGKFQWSLGIKTCTGAKCPSSPQRRTPELGLCTFGILGPLLRREARKEMAEEGKVSIGPRNIL
jgi:hypothetical protein